MHSISPAIAKRCCRKAPRLHRICSSSIWKMALRCPRRGSARGNVVNALKHIDFGDREIVVRVNPVNDEIGLSDIADIVPFRPDGICLPKVETVAEIQAADVAIRRVEISHGLPEGCVKLHAMIESAAGRFAFGEYRCGIAQNSLPRVRIRRLCQRCPMLAGRRSTGVAAGAAMDCRFGPICRSRCNRCALLRFSQP